MGRNNDNDCALLLVVLSAEACYPRELSVLEAH